MTNPVPEMLQYPHDLPAVLTYGGGTNSSAILVELIKQGFKPPTLIIFADTGAEMPHTYEHIKIMSDYAVAHGYPEITITKAHANSTKDGLESLLLHYRKLPPIAYGFKQCSIQFKVEPVLRYIKQIYGKGFKYVKITGYGFDERQRATNAAGKNPENEIPWYPLIEWQMGRDECVQSLIDAGLPLAGKSSCFFCPNKNASTVKEMAQQYPDLIARAIAIEDLAALADKEKGKSSSIVGLGRSWRWKDLIATDDMFGFVDVDKPMPCGCYDGDEDD
jgi:hypothetical protein